MVPPDPARRSIESPRAPQAFATTRWSMILRHGDDADRREDALAHLCRAYWFPLYAYVRRNGHGREDAEDLTQAFFAHLLGRENLGSPDPEKGRFRSFLLASMKRFLVDDWRKSQAEKRGGGTVPVSFDASEGEEKRALAAGIAPELDYDRRWATALADRVYEKLGAEYARAGKEKAFASLRGCLLGPGDRTYAALAAELGMSEGGFTMAVHRLRLRFAEEIRKEVADTVADPGEVDDEIRWLISVLSREVRPGNP